jgi:hypothetical protein
MKTTCYNEIDCIFLLGNIRGDPTEKGGCPTLAFLWGLNMTVIMANLVLIWIGPMYLSCIRRCAFKKGHQTITIMCRTEIELH